MSEIEITGLGKVQTSSVDYTTTYITETYKKNMDTLYRVFSKTTPLTEEDLENVKEAMAALEALARNGDSTTDPTRTMYMLPGMLESLKTVTVALNLALGSKGAIEANEQGFYTFSDKATVQDLESVKSLTLGNDSDGNPVSLADFLAKVMSADTLSATKTLVSMIELDFIPETFKMFAQILGGLSEGMRTTEEILSTLNQIMQIANMSKPGIPSDFKPLPEATSDIPPECVDDLIIYMNEKKAGSGDAFRTAWNEDQAWAKTESANNPQKYPTPEDALKDRTGASSKLKSFLLEEDITKEGDRKGDRMSYVMNKIYGQHFSELSSTPTPTENAAYELIELGKKLKSLIKELDPPSGSPPNLAYYLDLVVKDIDKAFEGIDTTNKSAADIKALYTDAVGKWILDNKDKSIGANINRAIEVAKNTNDKQNAKFKEEYEKFSEFIKLATMMLETIYKIFSGHAKGISG